MNNQTNIDRLDLAGVRLAIRLAEANLPAIRDDYRETLVSRIAQLQARAARLTAQGVK